MQDSKSKLKLKKENDEIKSGCGLLFGVRTHRDEPRGDHRLVVIIIRASNRRCAHIGDIIVYIIEESIGRRIRSLNLIQFYLSSILSES